MTMIVVTRERIFARYVATHRIIIDRGRTLVEGTPREVLASSLQEWLKALLSRIEMRQ
jgi:ABC-type polar amino acid transport system ATPase subunit